MSEAKGSTQRRPPLVREEAAGAVLTGWEAGQDAEQHQVAPSDQWLLLLPCLAEAQERGLVQRSRWQKPQEPPKPQRQRQ